MSSSGNQLPDNLREGRKSASYASRRNLILMALALPALLSYTIFFILPIFGNLFYSFMKWNGFSSEMQWVGFKNYIKLFSDDRLFYAALWHNIEYTVTVVVLQLSLALLFAMILYKKTRGHNLFKTIYLLPVILSNITLALIWSYMYDPLLGFLNFFLTHVGLGFLKQSWLGDQNIALFSVAFVNAWQYVGYSMLIFIAGLQTIPESLYEAANIDGAGIWSTFKNVTIPLLAPAITINLVLSTLGCFRVFELIYIMTQGGPNDATEVLTTLTYKNGFIYGEMGYASAISTVLLLIIMIVGFVQTKTLRAKEITY
jgi:raffinose/stachyose/melibiose transport system permease protein